MSVDIDQLMKILQATQPAVNRGYEEVERIQRTPVNRNILNKGQTAGDFFKNPTQNQSRAMLDASLRLLGGDTRLTPGQRMSQALQGGLQTLEAGRTSDRDQNLAGAKTGLESALDRRQQAQGMARPTTGDAPASVKEYEFLQGLSEDERKKFMALKRAGQVVQTPGNGLALQNPDGSFTTLITPEQATRLDAARAGAVEGAELDIKTRNQQLNDGLALAWGATDGYSLAESMKATSEEYLAMIESGEVDTGLIDAFIYNTFGVGSAELAAMSAEGTENLLKNLQIVNLAPVTEKELAEVMNLWAKISNQAEPNIGLLKRAIKRSERVMQMAQADAKRGLSVIKEYGGESQYESVLQTNDFLRQVIGRPVDPAPPPSAKKAYTEDTPLDELLEVANPS